MRISAIALRDALALVALLFVGWIVSIDAAGADDAVADGDLRYQIRAIRSEGASASVLYRLDSASGEICAFGFAQGREGELHGCIAGAITGPRSRFTLEALHGVRGTNQSSAYRLDRFTGEICRFRLPGTGNQRLEAVGCVATPPEAAAR